MLYNFPHNIKLSKSLKLETIDIKAPLTDPILKDGAYNGARTNTPRPIIAASTEEYTTLYNEHTGEEVKVIVPSGSILVEISNSDKTIYCLDEDVFFNIEYYKDANDRRFIVVNKAKWQQAVDEMSKRSAQEKEIALTASLNNEGIELEKNGKEDEAIIVYEKNVSRRCTATHSYDRLLVIYRKRKDVDNELRIAKLASAIFPKETKYQNSEMYLPVRITETVFYKTAVEEFTVTETEAEQIALTELETREQTDFKNAEILNRETEIKVTETGLKLKAQYKYG
jgi:hypothetical protein